MLQRYRYQNMKNTHCFGWDRARDIDARKVNIYKFPETLTTVIENDEYIFLIFIYYLGSAQKIQSKDTK